MCKVASNWTITLAQRPLRAEESIALTNYLTYLGSHICCVLNLSMLLAKLFTEIKLSDKKRQNVKGFPDWVKFLGVCLVLTWTASVNKFVPLMMIFLLLIYFAMNKKSAISKKSATNIKWKIFRFVHAIRKAVNKIKAN